MQDLTFRQMSLKMKRKEEVLGMRYEIKVIHFLLLSAIWRVERAFSIQ